MGGTLSGQRNVFFDNYSSLKNQMDELLQNFDETDEESLNMIKEKMKYVPDIINTLIPENIRKNAIDEFKKNKKENMKAIKNIKTIKQLKEYIKNLSYSYFSYQFMIMMKALMTRNDANLFIQNFSMRFYKDYLKLSSILKMFTEEEEKKEKKITIINDSVYETRIDAIMRTLKKYLVDYNISYIDNIKSYEKDSLPDSDVCMIISNTTGRDVLSNKKFEERDYKNYIILKIETYGKDFDSEPRILGEKGYVYKFKWGSNDDIPEGKIKKMVEWFIEEEII